MFKKHFADVNIEKKGTSCRPGTPNKTFNNFLILRRLRHHLSLRPTLKRKKTISPYPSPLQVKNKKQQLFRSKMKLHLGILYELICYAKKICLQNWNVSIFFELCLMHGTS